jgi:hypothetical protein
MLIIPIRSICLSSEYDEIARKGFRSKHYCKAVPLARLLERSKYRRCKCQAQAQCTLLPIFKAEARGQIESRDGDGTGRAYAHLWGSLDHESGIILHGMGCAADF